MQIRIEARLIWNINTSLSESAMKASPQRISCHFLELFLDAMQDRGSGTPMESLCVGWCWLGPGGDLKARQQVARECPCFPGLWVTRPLSNPTWTHWFIIGGGDINSASLWDPNYRWVWCFVLFLHQLSGSRSLFRVFQHSPASRRTFSGTEAKELLGAWHLDSEVTRWQFDNVFVQGWGELQFVIGGISSKGVMGGEITVISFSVCISILLYQVFP